MQPRSRPSSVSVTKVARAGVSAGERRPVELELGGRPPRSAPPAERGHRGVEQSSRSASASRAEAAYSKAKAP